MKCKFCGCTDTRACAIPMVLMDDEPAIALSGEFAEFTTPCHWISPNICSSPACVLRAYEELGDELVDLLFGGDELIA